MPVVKEYLYSFAIKLIHIWLIVEWIIIRLFLSSQVQSRIRKFCCLDGVNKDLITVHDPQFYIHTANKGCLGFCESYMNNWISIKSVHKVLTNIMMVRNVRDGLGFKYRAFLDYLEFELFASASKKSSETEDSYYNDNDLFEAILDPDMIGSCALWLKPTDTLESAQRNKMILLAKKMNLKAGMKVLDIGCGWGGMAKFLAEEYGVSVVATTTSEEGAKYTATYCKGLPVEVRLADCRDLKEKGETFDRVLAVEVLVYVGKKNYRGFFENIRQCLKDDGIFVLHAGGLNDPGIPSVNSLYNTMFPGIRLPYIKDIIEDTEGLFIMEDWSNMGANYEQTALAWNDNFQKVRNKFKTRNGEKFCRMWEFNMQTYSAFARTRDLQIWHIVFSKYGIPGGFRYEHKQM